MIYTIYQNLMKASQISKILSLIQVTHARLKKFGQSTSVFLSVPRNHCYINTLCAFYYCTLEIITNTVLKTVFCFLTF